MWASASLGFCLFISHLSQKLLADFLIGREKLGESDPGRGSFFSNPDFLLNNYPHFARLVCRIDRELQCQTVTGSRTMKVINVNKILRVKSESAKHAENFRIFRCLDNSLHSE
ncbi:hypothetical protein Pla144_07140 [Bythopirellula polymerisocia]|uniref:Uncharacterized protein n=1 Tax=Bythopirellula polymerisocia TaxID=2528003 RepID=A0A5C6CYB5_9BACT|nr:hypothetical protein Pla144_07140 [Bythopirellula polymerisocia]